MKLIECPRDAMQGIKEWIPTEAKIKYINQLLKVGFDTIDFGSFVSPKAIPQLADTAEVLANLDLASTNSKLLAIVANMRGVDDALQHKEIDYLGFPFSISETFQLRNTNSTITQSLEVVKTALDKVKSADKELVVYISMAFGNPYGDTWNEELVGEWTAELAKIGVNIIALSDTVGVANAEVIKSLFSRLIPMFPKVEIGAHLHTHPHNWKEKVDAALESGCKRFDSAIKGLGGCPMANDDLVGNMPTELIAKYMLDNGQLNIKWDEFSIASSMADYTFPVVAH